MKLTIELTASLEVPITCISVPMVDVSGASREIIPGAPEARGHLTADSITDA